MKAGDLIKTTCFGPSGKLGEVGIVVQLHWDIPRVWKVMFGGQSAWLVQDGLEVINESR